jgi:hypothetical protein
VLIWEDKDRDGLQNVGFFTVQPLDLANSPIELYYIQSLGKHQILHMIRVIKSRSMRWMGHTACMEDEKCIQYFGREETTLKT